MLWSNTNPKHCSKLDFILPDLFDRLDGNLVRQNGRSDGSTLVNYSASVVVCSAFYIIQSFV